MLSVPDKVKGYDVLAPLGAGGMATLYLARRRGVGGFSRLVTLKLIHKHLVEDEAMIERFLLEARISAHIAHPNVVRVEEVGQCGDSYFIAMEYVHGVSLAELLEQLHDRGMRLRPTLCVWLAAQVAEALHAAHEATGENGAPLGIVHHDVSPQNVLIAHTGHVKLIDFGIAKCRAGAEQSSPGSLLLGKLRYMSPEQLRLERVDRKSDVYALGVMLWEMLAGRPLLRCHGVDDERDWAIREAPPPPSRYSQHCMPWLDKVVLKALTCNPNERYATALELRSDLLDADPSAVRLDAPLVATLLHSVLGDELDRRRAGWPSEIAGELGAAQSLPPRALRFPIHQLTAVASPPCDLGPPSAADDDDDMEPTRAGIGGARARWEQGLSAVYERFTALGSLPAQLAYACATGRGLGTGRAHRSAQSAHVPEAQPPDPRWQVLLDWHNWSVWHELRLLRAELLQHWAVLTAQLTGQGQRAWLELCVLTRLHRVVVVGTVCLSLELLLGSRLSHGFPTARALTQDAPQPLAATPSAPPRVQPTTTLVSTISACPNEDLEPAEPAQEPVLLTATRQAERIELPPVGLRRNLKPRTAAIGGKVVGARKPLKRNARVPD